MKPSNNNLDNGKLRNLGITEVEKANLMGKYKSLPRSVGQRYAIDNLNGINLTPKQAIQANCFDCTGGIKDCIAYTCPLHKSSDYKDKDFDAYEPERIQAIIDDYENNAIKSAGNSLYLKYLKGERLTHLQLINAKCAECTAGFADGRVDCKITTCLLHQYMPYRGKTK